MDITEKQKKAGRKVIEVALLMQLAIHEAEREGLSINISHWGHNPSTLTAKVTLEQVETVATTERRDKK